MHTLTITLKQHTPLIHFQHNQDGATLRATEVKPKLDRFLLKNHTNSIDDKWIKKSENGEKALDYKIYIEKNPNSTPVNISIEEYSAGVQGATSLVLANMGKPHHEKKQFVFDKAQNDYDFKIIIFCLYDDLQKLIAENFCKFLMRVNFGNRQTKGFGSFYLCENDPNHKNPQANYWFTIDLAGLTSESDKNKRLFEHINLFWRALRAGINDGYRSHGSFVTTFYFKSLMFAYAHHHNIQWEKKTIKNNIFSGVLATQQGRSHTTTSPLNINHPTKYLMKDMLGLSLLETWLADFGDEISKTHKVQTSPNAWIDPNADEKISRMASPIIFKPVFNSNRTSVDVFIAINVIPSEIREKWFEIKNNAGILTHIQFPSSAISFRGGPTINLNPKSFFEFLFVNKNNNRNYIFDLDAHIENRFKTQKYNNRLPHQNWSIIKDIFNQIRRNYPQQNP